jgi:hypothetical protein
VNIRCISRREFFSQMSGPPPYGIFSDRAGIEALVTYALTAGVDSGAAFPRQGLRPFSAATCGRKLG